MYRKTFTYEGKRYDIKATTQEELFEKMAEKKQALKTNTVKETNMLVKDWLKFWVNTFKMPYVSERTQSMYSYAIKCINEYIGYRQLKSITSSDIQNIMTRESQVGSSRSRIDKIYMTLKQAFERAEIDEKIKKTPVKGIRKPNVSDKPRRILTREERAALLRVAEYNDHGAWILTMLMMGLRPSETAMLQGFDVNHKRKELHVRGTKSYSADRYIPIPSDLWEYFSQFHGDEYIFTTTGGKSLTTKTIRRWWESYKHQIDIEMGATVYRNQIVESVIDDGIVLYSLRHTFGTDCVTAGIDALTLAKLMGHADIRTTNKYYVHQSPEMRDNARIKLEALHEMWK